MAINLHRAMIKEKLLNSSMNSTWTALKTIHTYEQNALAVKVSLLVLGFSVNNMPGSKGVDAHKCEWWLWLSLTYLSRQSCLLVSCM